MKQDFGETSFVEIPCREFFEMLQQSHHIDEHLISKVYWFKDCRVTEIQTRDGTKYLRQLYK